MAEPSLSLLHYHFTLVRATEGQWRILQLKSPS